MVAPGSDERGEMTQKDIPTWNKKALCYGAVAQKMFVGAAPSPCSSGKNVRGRHSITVQ